MKLITKLRKADSQEKTSIWCGLNLNMYGAEDIVKEMILSLPGSYHLYNRDYGENLVDTVFNVYGWMPSMLISEKLILGLECTHPKKIRACFTYDLDVVEIKK